MNEYAPDLRRGYPRSPNEKMNGYVHLARMVDKARAKAVGTAGEYIYPCPLDQILLQFLGIPSDTFYEAVQERNGLEFLNWLKREVISQSPDAIDQWNTSFLNREPNSVESKQHFLEIRNQIAPHRMDITTWTDLLDLEEGREVPQRSKG